MIIVICIMRKKKKKNTFFLILFQKVLNEEHSLQNLYSYVVISHFDTFFFFQLFEGDKICGKKKRKRNLTETMIPDGM